MSWHYPGNSISYLINAIAIAFNNPKIKQRESISNKSVFVCFTNLFDISIKTNIFKDSQEFNCLFNFIRYNIIRYHLTRGINSFIRITELDKYLFN